MKRPKQNTIQRECSLRGVGLHSGLPAELRLVPAAPGTGIVFRRTDLDGVPDVPARVEYVRDTDRGTTLGNGEARVATVEHLLAALVAQQVDNVRVELDAPEVPIADGSAAPFTALLEQAGSAAQEPFAEVLRVAEPLSVNEGDASYAVLPSERYRVSTTIEWAHPLIGRQFGSFHINDREFSAQLASARTFCLEEEVETLLSRGLARGGSQENAVVLTADGVLAGAPLRFADEFVRHKTLDVVGDLALVGSRIAGHVIAERPGHHGNVTLARRLAEQAERGSVTRPVLDIQKILEYLPHRYPLLLVDRVVEFEERKRIVGIKNVTINEPFFVGHYPGYPIMPGVLIIEAMAQVGALLVMDLIEDRENKVAYFMSLDKVKWRRPVTPGDQLRFEVEVLQMRGSTCRMRGVGLVEGNVVAEAEMMARVVDR